MLKLTCVICGRELSETNAQGICVYCGKREKADYICPEGHYICEECRTAQPLDLIKKTCENTTERDPVKIALLLMKHPSVNLFGIEHHALVACSLLAAAGNVLLASGKEFNKRSAIERAIKRLEKFGYGSCGSTGVCGAAAGAGTAVSVFTNATYTSDAERSAALRAVSESLGRIASLGGPRCCKASAFISVLVGAEIFRQHLGVNLPRSDFPKPCLFIKRNRECLRERCPYYGAEKGG
jgi:hypothetical protein